MNSDTEHNRSASTSPRGDTAAAGAVGSECLLWERLAGLTYYALLIYRASNVVVRYVLQEPLPSKIQYSTLGWVLKGSVRAHVLGGRFLAI